MNGGRITLTTAEQRRLIVLNHLESGALVNAEAARLLDLSVRQLQRMKAAYADLGAAALSHGNRGRRPVHALDPELARKVVELATTTYAGFNQQHLTELLVEEHGLAISKLSVHRILTAAGVPAPRKRRPPRHRHRRDRYPKAGMLVQVDTSRHDWLEGRGLHLSLVGAIDDATGEVLSARFRKQGAQGYFEVIREVVRRRGIPLALFADRHSIFVVTKDTQLTLDEELAGRSQPTSSVVSWASSESALSLPAHHGPKAAWNGCGEPSKTASSASFALPRLAPRTTPTRSLSEACPP